ncbi:MAG: VWA domain-containing protein [Desulfobacterales bacterium]
MKLLLDGEAYNRWRILGKKIQEEPSAPPSPTAGSRSELYTAFCQACPAVLKEGSYDHLNNWGEQGLEIAARSLPVAVEFFRSTPVFLRSESVSHLRAWASGVMQLLTLGDKGEPAATAFFASSAELLQFMTFRELREWTRTGLSLARMSANLAGEYFSIVPDGLDQLYSTEWLRICKIGAPLAKTHPGEVLVLFEKSPSLLLKISPAVRNSVLDAAQIEVSANPATVNAFLHETVMALRGLLYPTQEIVLAYQYRIGEISLRAARCYMNTVGRILDRMDETFLPQWIETGVDVLKTDIEQGIRYFSLRSSASGRALSKWENAVLLDDFQQQLSLFSHALSGKRLEVETTDALTEGSDPSKRQLPTGNGEKVYLPPYTADGQDREANFRQYKMAAAHQAGCVAYGTFDEKLLEILSRLEALASGELAMDIFSILEDGRIDRLLGEEYLGLKQDMDVVLSQAMEERPEPSALPLHSALVEILLLRSTGYLVESNLPGKWLAYVREMDEILAPYEQASSVWDIYILSRRIYDYISQLPDSKSYLPSMPIPYRGRLDPALLSGPRSLQSLLGRITGGADAPGGVLPMPLEELRVLIDKIGIPSNLKLFEDTGSDAKGLYISDLNGVKAKGQGSKPGAAAEKQELMALLQGLAQDTGAKGPFHYDEWDFHAKSYRRKWCDVHEKEIVPAESGRVDEIAEKHKDLIERVRKQFQRIRPDNIEIIRRVEWGDDIDFSAMVQGVVERKAGTSPSEKIFTRREKKIRQVSTLFLLDMSASTSEQVPVIGKDTSEERKIIDIEIEGLVVLMEALEALSDTYGVFGFSGYGRNQVDFYRIKDFSDTYSEALKQRICGIEPKQGTRMGPAIRHAVGKLKALETDQRILLLLSDGYPQDYDYGENRRSNEYGLHDTMMALLEAKKEGIRPFCITVDQSGNDYLRKMCDPRSYLVIQDIHMLPEILPKVVASLMD